MTITNQIAKHFREIHFGGNWTYSNLKETLQEITWKQAITKVDSFNTIAELTYHINYFTSGVLEVLEGSPLVIKDAYSFNAPEIHSEEEWQQLLSKVWSDAKKFTALVEQLPDTILLETFADEKYGNYYRNFHGIIEHSHYHLGQIVIIKKLLLQKQNS